MAVRRTFSGGLRAGEDAYYNQLESDQLRELVSAGSSTPVISSISNNFIAGTPTTTSTTVVGAFRYCPAYILKEKVEVNRWTFQVSANVATAVHSFALYVKPLGNDATAKIISPTTVYSNAAVISTVSGTFSSSVKLPVGALIYFGWTSFVNNPNLVSTTGFNHVNGVGTRFINWSGSALPTAFNVSSGAVSAGGIPVMIYYSPLLGVL